MGSISVLSPAKINILLKVLGKRADGYHELYTLMEPISLFDKISIEANEGDSISIECAHSEVPSDNSNLAGRAAELFLEKTGLTKALTIKIDKSIPVGAGLGGGSSNAASVLMALNEMLNTGLPDDELKKMGAEIGSDVPFFILKGPAVATGRGEVLRRVSLPGLFYILINPGFSVSTKWVYGNLDLTNNPENNILSYSDRLFESLTAIVDNLTNDLEAVTLTKFPEISGLKRLLMNSGATGALMSGSGPTVFGLFTEEKRAIEAFKFLRDALAGSNSTIFLARGLLKGQSSEKWDGAGCGFGDTGAI